MAELSATTEMKQVLSDFPGAKRALFAKYHIGGCSSCAYRDDETLEGVCGRNEISVAEAIDYILESHVHDEKMTLDPADIKAKLDAGEGLKLVDIRTREEHEAVTIDGAIFMTQELQQEAFGSWDPNTLIVLFDHTGSRSLDTCAWFRGHKMANTFVMRGGIDAWSKEIDKSVPRYRMEME